MSKSRILPILGVLALVSCSGDKAAEPRERRTGGNEATSPTTEPCAGASCVTTPTATGRATPMSVRFLGVGGFVVEHGGEAVMTVPLYTRPTMTEVTLGTAVKSDAALVAELLPSSALTNVKTILSGHAHYDHLLDAPAVMGLAPATKLYANRSAQNLLTAFAPDRAPSCANTEAGTPTIARSRVVALDDPLASYVDYTNCPTRKPPGAPEQGRWVRETGSNVRFLAVCSEHPDQFGPVHFGAGDVEEEQCTPPTSMDEWREGTTLAFVIDFLDPSTSRPLYRVYYQDAPTPSPLGFVPPAILAEKRVDIALLCVGSYQNAEGNPGTTVRALNPRFALGGHWEDFLVAAKGPPQTIPFLDLDAWTAAARAELPPVTEESAGIRHDGATMAERAMVPRPGDVFEVRSEN